MKNLLIIFPMSIEASAAFEFFGKEKMPAEGTLCSLFENEHLKLSALVSGFGCPATRKRIADAMEKTSPSTVILCGCGGACSPNIALGDLLYSSESHGDFCESLGMKKSKIATVDHIAEKEEKRSLNEKGAYEAVEMEGSIVEEEMRKLCPNATFMHLRVISDGLSAELPSGFLKDIMNFDKGSIEITKKKLFISFLKRPGLIFTLPKFAKEMGIFQKGYDSFLSQKFLPKLLEEFSK